MAKWESAPLVGGAPATASAPRWQSAPEAVAGPGGQSADRIVVQPNLSSVPLLGPVLALAGYDGVPRKAEDGYEPSSVPVLDPLSTFANKAVEAVPVIGPGLKSLGEGIEERVYGEKPGTRSQIDAANDRQYRNAALMGEVAGTAAPLAGVGATSLGAKLLGLTGRLPARMAVGGASSGVISGIDALARGEGPGEARDRALFGLGVGTVVPGAERVVGALVQRLFGGAVPKHITELAKDMKAEGLDVPTARQRLADLGSEGMLADLGPKLGGRVSIIGSAPGEGQSLVRQRLIERAKASSQRIRDTLDNTLGPSPIPSMEQAGIRASQDALQPNYGALLSQGRPVSVGWIAKKVSSNIKNLRGEPQRALERILPMLNDYGTDKLTRSPQVLFEVRKAIDGMFEGDLTSHTRQVLTELRQNVDDELADKVPYLKQLDAKYAELARQGEALDRGSQVLSDGKTAPWPVDLQFEYGTGSPGVQQRMSQGARAEIERIVGNNANDVQALRRLIKGEGDWNRDRLATLFGKDKADQIIKVVENEAQFSRTYNLGTGSPESGRRVLGGEELRDMTLDIPKNASPTGLALHYLGKGASAVVDADAQKIGARMGDVLTRRGGQTGVETAQLEQALRPIVGHLAPATAAVLASRYRKPITALAAGGAGPMMMLPGY